MADRLIGAGVSITRYVSDDYPGFVELDLCDAHGRHWRIVEKAVVVSGEYLDRECSYPRPAVVACEIVERKRDAAGNEIVVIDTERPWGIESQEGQTRFEVRPAALIEWEWGSDAHRLWDDGG